MTSSPPRTDARLLPEIIQGGMGVAISDWRLARATARDREIAVRTVLAPSTARVTSTATVPAGIEPVRQGKLATAVRPAATSGNVLSP